VAGVGCIVFWYNFNLFEDDLTKVAEGRSRQLGKGYA